MVAVGFLWLFVFVVVAADQVHFFFKADEALPQTTMVERKLAINQMAELDRSWRVLCHGAQFPAFLMLAGAALIGFGSRSKKQKT